MQAARLSQIMAENQFGGNRPRLGAVNTALATVVVAEAQQRLDEQAARADARATQTAEAEPVKTETELPGYMSPSEFADLKSALQKRPRLSPDMEASEPPAQPKHHEPDNDHRDRNVHENNEGVAR